MLHTTSASMIADAALGSRLTWGAHSGQDAAVRREAYIQAMRIAQELGAQAAVVAGYAANLAAGDEPFSPETMRNLASDVGKTAARMVRAAATAMVADG